MVVLMVPYLFFRDFSESSGVIHQAEIAKALARNGATVIVALPAKSDGWKYDEERYFGGVPGVHTIQVEGMPKNQLLWAGFAGKGMYDLLSPIKTKIPFDVLLNGNPPCAASWKRVLSETGYTRLKVPVFSYFDWVHAKGAGSGPRVPLDYLEIVGRQEVLASVYGHSLVTTFSQYHALKGSLRQHLKPSEVLDALNCTHYIPKPLTLPEPIRRVRPEEFRVFVGRGFGPELESTGPGGPKVHECLIDALVALVASGSKVKLVVCTASDLGAWYEVQAAKLGAALELHHKITHDATLEVLKGCHIAVDLRKEDGLFLAAIEQSCSGAVNITLDHPGVNGEVMSNWRLPDFDAQAMFSLLKQVMDDYDSCATLAYNCAKDAYQKHHYTAWARVLKMMQNAAPPETVARNKSLKEKIACMGEGNLYEVMKAAGGKTGWGRTPLAVVTQCAVSEGFRLTTKGTVADFTWELTK